MKVFNKLVRDKIPDIILADNQLPVTRVLKDDEYVEALNNKLLEEVKEYLDGNNVNEIADILEVIRAIVEQQGLTMEEIEEKRVKKAEKRGAFKDKIFLEKIMENGD